MAIVLNSGGCGSWLIEHEHVPLVQYFLIVGDCIHIWVIVVVVDFIVLYHKANLVRGVAHVKYHLILCPYVLNPEVHSENAGGSYSDLGIELSVSTPANFCIRSNGQNCRGKIEACVCSVVLVYQINISQDSQPICLVLVEQVGIKMPNPRVF